MYILEFNLLPFAINKNIKKGESDYEKLLDKWFQFREEELESNLNDEDKKYSYCFAEHRNNILNCIGEEKQNLVNSELDKLERQVIHSMDYFNKKYYNTGFNDAINLIVRK